MSPGTEIKVIPERDAPTIPKATKYQGDSLFAEKKVWLSSLPVVKLEIIKSPKKYRKMTVRIIDELILKSLIKYTNLWFL